MDYEYIVTVSEHGEAIFTQTYQCEVQASFRLAILRRMYNTWTRTHDNPCEVFWYDKDTPISVSKLTQPRDADLVW